MSLFGDNLVFYRKRENMTQEQLAEKLDVSRQTVSKWEAGTSYAEMEKLLQLCELFSCDMDTLLRKNASETIVEDNRVHREYMRKFRRGVTMGVTLIIAGVALYELFAGVGVSESILDTVFMIFIIVGILILIVHGMQDENYKKKHPVIQDFYTEEEKDVFNSKLPVRMAAGVGLILIGMLIFGMNGDSLPLRVGMTEDFYYGLFMICVTIAVGIFVYNSMKKEEYDIEKYNRDNNPDPDKRKTYEKLAVWCGCIMLVATILFLIAGLVFGLWEICWIAYPIGGLLCGIVALVIQRGK